MSIFWQMAAGKCVSRWRNSKVIPMKPFSQWLNHVDEISTDAALHGLLACSWGDFSRIGRAQQLAPHTEAHQDCKWRRSLSLRKEETRHHRDSWICTLKLRSGGAQSPQQKFRRGDQRIKTGSGFLTQKLTGVSKGRFLLGFATRSLAPPAQTGKINTCEVCVGMYIYIYRISLDKR